MIEAMRPTFRRDEPKQSPPGAGRAPAAARRRREVLLATLALLVAAPAARAQAALQARPGKEFRVLNPVLPTDLPPGKLEVVEFFWYGCPHCNQLEPLIRSWALRLPIDVVFRRVHVPFRERKHQQLHYALEVLDKVDTLGPKVFEAIHRENNPLDSEAGIADWAVKQGLERKAFLDAFKSFSVRTRMSRATKLAESFGVDGVPALGINGKYYTSPSMAGSNAAALALVDSLLAEERRAAAAR